MAQFILHGSPASTYVRTVRLLLEEKGLTYDLRDVSFVTGENKTEAFGLLHPYNKMPVLEDGDFKLYETIAIVNYIERAYPQGNSFRPTDVKAQANMERLINAYSSYMFGPMIGKVVWERVVEPLKNNQPDESIVNDALPIVTRAMRMLNEELGENTYFIENKASLFDFFLAPSYAYLMMVDELKKLHEELPNLKRWYDAISATDSFKATA